MMKIPKSIRDTYTERKPIYVRLESKVRDLINGFKDPRWHYESRVKDLESFSLKVETGRYRDGTEMEDFLACTVVVENLDRIPETEKMIGRQFLLHERRPKNDRFTTKRSDSFPFDDLRLYVKWTDDPSNRPTGLHGLIFEVQIKTFLQHAWSIATHDLTYKSDEKSWPKERIAFQIKAMLEHAETSIVEAKKLASSSAIKKVDGLTKRISAVTQLVNELWLPTELPSDKKRLAENIEKLISGVGVDLKTLKNLVLTETAMGRGTKTLNLSPYAVVVQSLLNQESAKMISFVSGPDQDFKVYICREIQLPEVIDRTQLRNAILDW